MMATEVQKFDTAVEDAHYWSGYGAAIEIARGTADSCERDGLSERATVLRAFAETLEEIPRQKVKSLTGPEPNADAANDEDGRVRAIVNAFSDLCQGMTLGEVMSAHAHALYLVFAQLGVSIDEFVDDVADQIRQTTTAVQASEEELPK